MGPLTLASKEGFVMQLNKGSFRKEKFQTVDIVSGGGWGFDWMVSISDQ